MNLLTQVKKIPLFLIIVVSVNGCKSADPVYSRCEERCEYSRRDCMEKCENYTRFGLSMDFGSSGFNSPYACTEKCDKNSEKCIERCRENK